MPIPIKFPESGHGRNMYATIYLDHKRVTDEWRCSLYVRIVADHGAYIHVEEVNDPDGNLYISKDVIAVARIEDR